MELKRASILLVEDEPILREIMGEWLGRMVGQVFCAEDGVEALKLVTGNRIDLLISDVRMPGMDGIALLKKINETKGHRPPMIFITGFSDLPLRQAHDIGADAILEKPIRREELLSIVKHSLMKADELWRELPETAPEMQLKISMESLASALEEKRIAFGRRGFCLAFPDSLHEGPLEFTLEFQSDQRALSGHGVVRWIAPEEHQAGIEITYLDDAGRGWLIDLLEQSAPVAFIPGTTGMQEIPGVKTA
jgi:two-component system chemotaxis response regulator CheY